MTRRAARIALSLAGALALPLVPPAAATPLDTHRLAVRAFGNDAPWYEARIPFFDSSDPLLNRVYYYRWQIFRAHQRDLGQQGYITTEFLDDVGWQREPYASLNDATGFHIGEGRWLRDRRYVADYIDYMLEGGGDDRHFSDYIADAVWSRYLVDGDRAEALRHLPALRRLYDAWDDHYDRSKGLYWIEPLLDATEYTISSIDASGGKDGFRGGDAFRPSINSYMFANARALAGLTALAGVRRAAIAYAVRADTLRRRVEQDLWSASLGHFIDRYKVDNAFVKYWQPIRGRELVGYVPWAFDLPADDPRFAQSWRHLLAPDRLAGAAGLRTVEPSYPFYLRQYRYAGANPECQWNGPVWPFQTTQALAGLINLLDHYHQSVATRADFLRLLRQYAALHLQDGKPDLEEDYDPATGRPIVGLARSHHYFHSGFVDLVMTGVVGIRPRADDVLEVNPLLPGSGDARALRWFRVEHVPYHGHEIAVTWDDNGRHYRRGVGLRIEVDGHVVAQRRKAERVRLPLPRSPARPIDRPIDVAVQLTRGAFPRPSASSGGDPESLHGAVDGRLWFFPDQANGWTAAPTDARPWFAIDFGRTVTLSSAMLAFMADGTTFSVPRHYTLQYLVAQRWQDVPAAKTPLVGNGVTSIKWRPITTSAIRLVVSQRPNTKIRLVEIKLFS